MIIVNGKELRNLEEQVLENQINIQSIIEGSEVLSRFGLKVVGYVPVSSQLPDATTYEGEYGDAIAVGSSTPYEYWVFTRPFAGQVNPQWFDLGKFPAPGPQGETGPQGEQGATGERGSQWFIGRGSPSTTYGYRVGDMFLDTELCDVYHLHAVEGFKQWLLEANIRGETGATGRTGARGPAGATGPRGPQGPIGPTAAAVEIQGVISSISQLPDPTLVARNAAYLINGYLYIIVTDTATNGLKWVSSGMLNAGSTVMSGGAVVKTFDADTKVNKTDEAFQIYGTDYYGEQTTYSSDDIRTSGSSQVVLDFGTIPKRESDGALKVPLNTTKGYAAISKSQADNSYFKVSGIPGTTLRYVPYSNYSTSASGVSWSILTNGSGANTVPIRDSNGNIGVGSLIRVDHALSPANFANTNANRGEIRHRTFSRGSSIVYGKGTPDGLSAGHFYVTGRDVDLIITDVNNNVERYEGHRMFDFYIVYEGDSGYTKMSIFGLWGDKVTITDVNGNQVDLEAYTDRYNIRDIMSVSIQKKATSTDTTAVHVIHEMARPYNRPITTLANE